MMEERAFTDFAIIVDRERDNVAVAKQEIPAGTVLSTLSGDRFTIQANIYPGHRFAIQIVPAGEWLRQYGQPFAISRGLLAGAPVNTETVENSIPSVDPSSIQINPPVLPSWEGSLPVFQGFHRTGGQVGTRNWVLIVPTSMCSSHEAATIAAQAEFSGVYSREKYPNVDGVAAIPHTRGCGCPDFLPSGAGADRASGIVEVTMRLLAAFMRHPNVGAALLIDLGCEKTNLRSMKRFTAPETGAVPSAENPAAVAPIPGDLSAVYGKPVYSLSIQNCGGTRATIRRGLELLPALLEEANRASRAPAPISALGLGLKCGGSDAFSGLSANPALGYASDLLVRAGGSSVITEIPEFFGAEHLFASRASRPEVARAVFQALDRYRAYTARAGHSMAENPTPGNKEGGLLNITIKSLGALAKSGTAPVAGVLDYGESFWARSERGLFLMYGPGYDQESIPPLVAGGCQVICFTTGRGTGIGSAIAPVIKIASNSVMYRRMQDDIDVNAGAMIDQNVSLEEMGRRIFEEVAAVASGKQTRAELNGHREFTIWSEEGISL